MKIKNVHGVMEIKSSLKMEFRVIGIGNTEIRMVQEIKEQKIISKEQVIIVILYVTSVVQ